MNKIKEIWAYRQMVISLVKKDLRSKYKASVLGFLWTFLNPLLQLLVYTFVFSVIMPNNIKNYAMFLFVALVPWIFLASSLQTGSMCVVSSKNLVQKIYFPRITLPLASTCASFMNMLLTFVVLFIALIITGIGISPTIWLLPLIMVIQFFFVLGLTLIVSGLNVYFRDLEQIISIGTLAWQFLSPVMYGIENVPEALRPVFNLNPMTSIIVSYRDILYNKVVPDLSTLGTTVLFAIAFIVIGYFLFQRLQRGFAEEL